MTLVLRAYGKLNLTLEVLGRRPDGYHQVVSVLQTVSLADVLTFRPGAQLTLRCSDRALESEGNLVLQAARLLQTATGCSRGVAVVLEKGIPTAGGLGGGSADAAATLWALARLWDLPAAQLPDLAARLGSDVPFFLEGGTALAQGRGERIIPLPPAPESWFLVVRPKLDIPEKTATLYHLLGEEHWTRGGAAQQLAEALRQGERVREAHLYNVFDRVAPEAFPAVGRWRRWLLEAAPARPHLTGTGPSLYIPVASEDQGREVLRQLAQHPGADLFLVRSVPHPREVLLDEGVE